MTLVSQRTRTRFTPRTTDGKAQDRDSFPQPLQCFPFQSAAGVEIMKKQEPAAGVEIMKKKVLGRLVLHSQTLTASMGDRRGHAVQEATAARSREGLLG